MMFCTSEPSGWDRQPGSSLEWQGAATDPFYRAVELVQTAYDEVASGERTSFTQREVASLLERALVELDKANVA